MKAVNDPIKHKELRGFVAFGCVGIAATAVHTCIGLALVWSDLASPFIANFIAFSTAVSVSYVGHRTFTFQSTRRHQEALPRFFAVALFGLLLNQIMVWGLVDVLGMAYPVVLALIFVSVPIAVYILSRTWAFAEPRSKSDR